MVTTGIQRASLLDLAGLGVPTLRHLMALKSRGIQMVWSLEGVHLCPTAPMGKYERGQSKEVHIFFWLGGRSVFVLHSRHTESMCVMRGNV
jgi:hypothetical protein